MTSLKLLAECYLRVRTRDAPRPLPPPQYRALNAHIVGRPYLRLDETPMFFEAFHGGGSRSREARGGPPRSFTAAHEHPCPFIHSLASSPPLPPLVHSRAPLARPPPPDTGAHLAAQSHRAIALLRLRRRHAQAPPRTPTHPLAPRRAARRQPDATRVRAHAPRPFHSQPLPFPLLIHSPLPAPLLIHRCVPPPSAHSQRPPSPSSDSQVRPRAARGGGGARGRRGARARARDLALARRVPQQVRCLQLPSAHSSRLRTPSL